MYRDFCFRFAVADCARIAPAFAGLLNMLGDALDAQGELVDEEAAAFHGRRVGDDIYLAYRVDGPVEFDPVALGMIEVPAEESAGVLGVWA
jgi:hypothetical protein